jgi:hypothetical protein
LALIEMEHAKSPDVLQAILQSEWDLVVSDSVPPQDSRRLVFEALLEKKNAKRLLILENAGQEPAESEALERLGEVATTRWAFSAQQLVEFTGTRFHLRVLPFERSREEVEFLRGYQKLAGLMKTTPNPPSANLRLACSSLYAAEQSLRRVKTPDPAAGAMEIRRCLELLNRVPSDNKLDALLRYLRDEGRGRQILLQSSFAATLAYLASSLGEERTDTYPISASLSSDEIRSTVDRFQEQGGVLIASTGALRGLAIAIDELIIYDMLIDPLQIGQGLVRLFWRHPAGAGGQAAEKTIVAFLDQARAIPQEEQGLRQFERIVRQFGS